MSKVYEKAKSEKFGKYFSRTEDFEKNLASYFVKDCKLKSSRRFGVAGKGGVPLSFNASTNTVFIDDSDAHSLIIGSTGSKKSRLVAMPTVRILSLAKESMIISDPKAEIYKRTAYDLKNKGYKIVVINLREPNKGDAWNPLAVPYNFYCANELDRAYEFANDIAVNLSLIDKSQKDPFWDNSAASFFFGLIMLLFKYCKDNNKDSKYVNIANILELRNCILSDDFEINTRLKSIARKDPFIYSLLVGTLESASGTMKSILSTFDQKMRTFTIQPSLLGMLSGSELLFENIQQEPTAIFLIVPDEKTTYHNLVSLFIKQSYEYMIFNSQSKFIDDIMPIRVNYILDEFSSLPSIHDFPAMITAARSRNIRFNLFVQSKHQLDLRYKEEADTIRANCSNWIFLVSRELSLLKEVSELCGEKRDNGAILPVLSVVDLQRLDKDEGEVLILSGRNKPFITQLLDIDKYDLKNYSELNLRYYDRNVGDIRLNFYDDLKSNQSPSKSINDILGELE